VRIRPYIPTLKQRLAVLLLVFPLFLVAQSSCPEAEALRDLSYAVQQDNLDSALLLAYRARKSAVACEDSTIIVQTELRIGAVLEAQERYEEAIRVVNKTYSYGVRHSKLVQARSASVLFNIYDQIGAYKEAMRYGRFALQLSREVGATESVVKASINLANALFDTKPDSALFLLREARPLAVSEGLERDVVNIDLNRAIMLASEARLEEARAGFYELVHSPIVKEDEFKHFFVLLNLGNCLSDLGRDDSADHYLRKAHVLARKHNLLSEEAYAAEGLYHHFKALEQHDSALSYHELAWQLNDSLVSLERVKHIAVLREAFEADVRELEIKELEQSNRISDLQRNFFIVMAFLFLAIATAAIVIYSNRIRHNKAISEERIHKLEKEKEVLSLQSMLVAQEEERQRIARDLHDSIGALLSAAKLHISNIETEVKKLNELNFLKSTEDAIDRASVEVRRVAHDMMPGVLMKLGLVEGVEDFFDRIRKGSKLHISFTYDHIGRMNSKHEVMLYRIVQELVNNTIKHAEATEIKLMIHTGSGSLILDYRDNGKGFDVALLNDQNSFGLSGIKSRVNFLEGQFELESDDMEGTHYRMQFDLSKMV